MNMGGIMKILEGTSSKNLYSVTCKILDDYYNNSMDLPEDVETIETAKSICNTISNSKMKKISGDQTYAFREFVANNLGVYGNTTDEDDVKKLFRSLL